MEKESNLFRLYTLCIFFLFLDAMFPWYMWENKVRMVTILFTLLVSVYVGLIESVRFCLTKEHVFLSFFLLLSLFWNVIGGDGGWKIYLVMFFIWVYLFSLKIDNKRFILRFITKWTAYLVLISLIFYLLFWVDFVLVQPSIISFNGDQYVCFNYYTFILDAKSVSDFLRFKSIFMEPGHMTMGVVPLIMANGFDMKNRYVKILVLCELFTLSLAGYITLTIGFLLFNLSLRGFKNILMGICVLGGIIFLINMAGFYEILDKLIFDRLEYKDGDIAGNNRVTAEFEKVYQTFIQTSKVWTGDSLIDVTSHGGISGYKKYLVQNGIIGVVLFFAVYGYNYLMCFKYKVGVFTLILFILLLQNAYPYWFCMMCMYILGCDNLKSKMISK